jgi:hypothetical protein
MDYFIFYFNLLKQNIESYTLLSSLSFHGVLKIPVSYNAHPSSFVLVVADYTSLFRRSVSIALLSNIEVVLCAPIRLRVAVIEFFLVCLFLISDVQPIPTIKLVVIYEQLNIESYAIVCISCVNVKDVIRIKRKIPINNHTIPGRIHMLDGKGKT